MVNEKENMTKIRAEIVTRVDKDVWIRLLMNGGCNLIKGNVPPKYDNQVRAVLKTEEGHLDLRLTDNYWEDSTPKFVDAAVNFRTKDINLVIRVDNNNKEKIFHYNVEENGKTVEDHTKIDYDSSEAPLRFALRKVVEYFNQKYVTFQKGWEIFNTPPLTFLSNLLVFNPPSREENLTILPINFIAYPGSRLTMQVYPKKKTVLYLIPRGFVIEKKTTKKS